MKTLFVSLLAVPGMLLACAPARAQDMAVYSDSLQNGWQNWSWATTNLSNTSPVHGGADSISVTAGAWEALYLHSNPINTAAYSSLSFWINGGASGGQLLQVIANRNGSGQAAYQLSALYSGWQPVTIPLATLGVSNVTDLDGLLLQDRTGTSLPTVYLDDISLIGLPVGTVHVDAASNIHPISPYIYGLNWASTAQLSDLNSTVNRSGGNANSNYNWQLNATNRAADYFFESLGTDSSSTPGESEDSFVTATKAAAAEPMLTLPTIGWVAKLGPNRAGLASFLVSKYGVQQATDQWWPDAGNGILASGAPVTGNDPNDAYMPADVNFVKPDLTRLVTKFGKSANGGVKFYILDNEVGIWQGTHRDIHPVGAKMDEILGDMKSYGAAVKAADPSAYVVAPEEWNWPGFVNSGYDFQTGSGTDRAAHGGMEYYPYLLQQMRNYEQTAGVRCLDYLSAHFYPQGNDGSGSDTSTATELLRNRATRQLWDRNYTSESWINTNMYLIPHLQDWIKTYYPGTKTAITEYNWGVENTMNGATTLADELGIFGQQGLDLATRWGIPASPSYEAFKMYRNYDGNKSTFGDTSVGATVLNPDSLDTFAAIRSKDDALTIMVINKTLSGTTPVALNIANFQGAAAAHVWQLSSSAIVQQPDVPVTSGVITLTVPAPSVTLFVVPAVGPKLTAMTPTWASPGTAALTIALTGTGFNANSAVLWNGTALVRQTMSATQLTATVPAAYLATGGSAKVTVANSPSLVSNALTFLIKDTTAPSTNASTSGTAGANGWYTSTVTVSLAATDPEGSADVAATSYKLDGGAQQTYAAPLQFASEGTHTLVFWSIDKAGNTEAAHTLTIKIDKTAPALTFGAGTPAPNSAGWEHTSVQIPFTATDAMSGIASISRTSPVTITSQGASVTVAVTAIDKAGNQLLGTTPPLKIDLASPVTKATWLNGSLSSTVTLAATDALSGVASTKYAIDGGAQRTYAGPFAVNGIGTHTLTYGSTDVAGNVEATHTVTIVIAPAMSSISPTAAVAGTAGFTLTVNGKNFVNGATVAIAGLSLPATYVSVTKLTAAVPASALTAVRTLAVGVSESGLASNPVSFWVNAPSLSALTVSPASTKAGASATGMVKLNGPALSGGYKATLSSSSTLVTVPASVTVPAGSTSVTFAATTHGPVTANTAVTVTATGGAASRSTIMTVTP